VENELPVLFTSRGDGVAELGTEYTEGVLRIRSEQLAFASDGKWHKLVVDE
jgi:hypothetical protein